MAKSVLYNIYSDLVTAVNPVVGAKYVFLKDRPNVKDDETPMAKFVVIDIPTTIRDYVIGESKTMLQASGILHVFVSARSNNTLNLNAMGDLVDSLVELFPIKGNYAVATNPRVLMRGADGEGFQVTTITFDLRCRWGAFNSKS